ncbi:MAG TPA: molybdopterin dinucleotide-binding protein [Gammaproteobacteria bacterium]|nr:molybdopterin dinucleotide-binding protein [Gammaproteobacteria bacterium]
MSNRVNRRDFLKIMGWSGVGATLAGCDMPTTVTLEEGKEKVTSYLMPEEYVIPGVGVWYASTCLQCPAGCGVHGRVREGRVLKLEGNPESPINRGRLCQMGQSGLQAHYNPDRITQPLMRKGGGLTPVSWDEAMEALEQRTGPSSGLKGERFAWFTDTVSGHQAVLLDAHLKSMGSDNHYVHELINNSVSQAVNRDMLGDPMPRLRYDKAQAILSFGADIVGTWQSPVHNATEYAKFRSAPRGVLIQAEPNMSLTGANADLWVPVRPGMEGMLAMGIASVLATKHRKSLDMLPAALQKRIRGYDINEVARVTGTPGNHIIKIAAWLNERSPSLVISGPVAEGHERGYDIASAIMLLNVILGNVGETIEAAGEFPFPQLAPRTGGSRDLLEFAKALEEQRYDVVFFRGANPVYTAPAALKLADKLGSVGFKVAFSMFRDETTELADLVLPMRSPVEDWGTHVAAYRGGSNAISIQQPLMEPLYPETRGFGDVLLGLLKMRGVAGFTDYEDYYAYLRDAFTALPAVLKNGASDDGFWAAALQKGVIDVPATSGSLSVKVADISVPGEGAAGGEHPYHLVPAARLGLWDGRHANLPWLQEAPDQITKVVWNSWAEMHPVMARKLGVKTGDTVRISSTQGSIEANVYVYKGVHPDVIVVPMGRGHESYGRYAQGRGVNPLKILEPVVEGRTGELALTATRVQVSRAQTRKAMVRLGGSESQLGRRIVATVSADVFERTEGGA